MEHWSEAASHSLPGDSGTVFSQSWVRSRAPTSSPAVHLGDGGLRQGFPEEEGRVGCRPGEPARQVASAGEGWEGWAQQPVDLGKGPAVGASLGSAQSWPALPRHSGLGSSQPAAHTPPLHQGCSRKPRSVLGIPAFVPKPRGPLSRKGPQADLLPLPPEQPRSSPGASWSRGEAKEMVRDSRWHRVSKQ